MRSPFKFLDSFTLEDRDAFFGRNQEIEELYELIYETKLLIVYGNSGTGKTSLIQCGLASKFDGTDWFPIWLRRNENINDSLQVSLKNALGSSREEPLVITTAISEIFNHSLRPVYLIFDQFEELFILGSTSEQETFIEGIKTLVDSELPCKVLFIIREEYLGYLNLFERYLPNIFNYRLRVEPMSFNKITNVISSSFEKFNLKLLGNQESLLQKMIRNLQYDHSGIKLPFLQVYLDQIYRSNYNLAYQNSEPEEEFPLLTFDDANIEAFGNIQDVLERFLTEQQISVQQLLEERFGELPPNMVSKVMDIFITAEGTKRPIYYKKVGEEFTFDAYTNNYINITKVDQDVFLNGIKAFERRRLLRMTANSFELSHDSLAIILEQKRSEQERKIKEIEKRIVIGFIEYQQSGEFLSRKQLNNYEDFIPQLVLDDSIKQFIQDSYAYNDKLEAEEIRRKEHELGLIKQKLAAEEKVKKRQQFFIGVLILVLLGTVALGIYANNQRGLATQREQQSQQTLENLKESIVNQARIEFDSYLKKINKNLTDLDFEAATGNISDADSLLIKYTNTLELYQSGPEDTLFSNFLNPSIDSLSAVKYVVRISAPKLPDYLKNVKLAESLATKKQFFDAIFYLEKALDTGIDSKQVKQKITAVRTEGFKYFNTVGDSHYDNGTTVGFRTAKTFYDKALKITRNSAQKRIMQEKLDGLPK